MKRQKIGLVLSGGGAKGAYEIGVYKALTELGVTDSIQAIAGTSVGALNTLLLECAGVEKAERVWRDFRQVDLLYPSFQQLLNRRLPMFSGLSVAAEILENGMPVSQQRLSELVDQNIQMSNIHRDLYAVAYNTDKQQSEAFHLNQFPQEYIKQIVLASANIPFVYDGLIGMKIGQYSYIDGGCPKYNTDESMERENAEKYFENQIMGKKYTNYPNVKDNTVFAEKVSRACNSHFKAHKNAVQDMMGYLDWKKQVTEKDIANQMKAIQEELLKLYNQQRRTVENLVCDRWYNYSPEEKQEKVKLLTQDQKMLNELLEKCMCIQDVPEK